MAAQKSRLRPVQQAKGHQKETSCSGTTWPSATRASQSAKTESVIGVRENTLADGLGTSEGYYEEGREGRIIPYGTRLESGTLMGLDRGDANFLELRHCE